MSYITCKELIDFLDDYVADDLEPSRRIEFERHLRVCPSCRAYLASYRETIRLTRGVWAADPTTLPPELMTAILATVTRNTNG